MNVDYVADLDEAVGRAEETARYISRYIGLAEIDTDHVPPLVVLLLVAPTPDRTPECVDCEGPTQASTAIERSV